MAFSDPLPAVSAPSGRVANAPFLACLFSGLCFACLGHEACCRSRLSEASHRGILLGVGSNPAAVRAFRMGSFTAPRHVCGRFGLGTTFGSSTAFGVAVDWFRTQPRSEGAGHKKKCFMDSKGDGKHFFWLVFLACLSSDPLPTSFIFVSVQVIGWRCGILVSDPASQRGCWPQEMFYGFQR